CSSPYQSVCFVTPSLPGILIPSPAHILSSQISTERFFMPESPDMLIRSCLQMAETPAFYRIN
ncbi:hypothetical protein, partial [Escherichia coli]|uniref:hypothetical protein n=1 Tax=Escherichia coli TaxID=562 RepID=UPI001A7E08F7